jgi:RHS repeat-associated protein
LITLPKSGKYVLTVHAIQGQTGAYAFRLNETTQTALTVGSPYQGMLAGSGQAQLFTVTLSQPAALGIVLTDGNTNDQNELYVSLGSAPTRNSYQYRSSVTGANQTVALAGQPGTYYILVYNNLVTSPGSAYTLQVQGNPFDLTGLTPSQIGNGEAATLLVSGVFPLAYQSPTAYQIRFVSAGGTVYPASPLYLSPTSLGLNSGGAQNVDGTMSMSAMLPASALPPGTYSVRLTDNLGDTQTLTNALTVTAGGTGVLKTSVVVPNPIGYHQATIIYVTYSNVGTAPMPAPLLVLTATQKGQQGAFLSLDSALAGLGYVTDNTPAGFSQNVQFLASGAIPGILEPGETITVPVYYAGWLHSQWDFSRPPIIFSVGELDTANTQTIDWTSLKDDLRPGSINQAAWNAIFPVLTTQMGSTWGQYVQQFDNDAVYLASIGEPTSDLNQLLSFEIEKANAAYTAQTLVSVTPESLPAPGMRLTFVQSFQQSISGRYTQGILGFGWTTNWDISATTLANGDVVIKTNGMSLFFSLQPNGSYRPQAGDQGTTLTAAGAYQLTETDGTVYQFNVNGTLNYVQDTHGNRITTGYNTQGQLASLTHSNGESLTLIYNPQGRLAKLTDPNGQTETYGYDPTGQFLTSYTDVFGTTNYTYVTGQSAAQNNALAQIAYADNTHIYFGYDSQGRFNDQHRDGGEEDQAWTYLNPGGYTVTDANQNKATVYFNLFGATAETIDPLGNITRSYYDSNLNLIKVIGPGGATYAYTHDANGNVTSQTDPLGLTTMFTHDSHNNLTSYTDAKGNTTSYAYNSKNDLMSITYANGIQQHYSYNPLGQAMQYLNARGNPIGYTYTTQGLVQTETFADGTSFSYTYSPQGNLTSATDAQSHITTFLYKEPNNPNLLTEIDYPDGTWLKFKYNVVGQRTQSVDQTGFTVNYKYDTVGRLSQLLDGNGSLIVKYTYDHAGNLKQKDMGNDTRTVYEYDADGRVKSITNLAHDHVTVNSFDDYTCDARGNVQTDTNQDGQWVYTYDADSQLIHAIFTPNSTNPDKLTAQDLRYVYDAAGNRKSQTVNGVTTTYVVNNVNEYTSVTTNGVTTNFQYDADGNRTSDGVNNYTFNALNQLTSVIGPNTTTYAYDALGQRVAVTSNGQITHFQFDPGGLGNVVATFGAGGALAAHYTYGFGLVSQVSAAGITGYYDSNNIGSTVGITGANGSYVNKYAYLPFGQTIAVASPVVNPFTFVGQYGVQDNGIGVLDMRARTYSVTTGQFLSRDPNGIVGGDANTKRYVGNDPTTLIDALGTQMSPITPRRPLGPFEPGTKPIKPKEPVKPVTPSEPDKKPDNEPQQPNQKVQTPNLWPWVIVGGALLVGGAITGQPELVAAGVVLLVVAPSPPASAAGKASTRAVTSQDPNSTAAPSGYGPQNFVADTDLLPYQINFENDPTATAPAQRVDISDQLDPKLDWSTFQLTAVGFGSTYIAIPAGLQHYNTTVNIAYNGQTFEVAISLNLNPATGVFTASFQSTDPATDLPPTSILTGFLPPEDGTGRGLGFVSFTIRPKAGLATGTQIRNVAQIAFDFSPTIATDQVDDHDPSKGVDPKKQALVTIDAGPPTSRVNPLPAVTNSRSFTVSWFGADDPGGSGIAFFDIYVSTDGGPFTPFLFRTTDTSATFTGVFGHMYSFYSVATDNVGNREAIPTTAQASTRLIDVAPPTWPDGSQLQAGNVQTTSLTLTWTAAQHSAGIASYRIFQGTTLLATVDGATRTYTVTGLTPSTAYQFKVEAVNPTGQQSTTGPSVAVTTAATVPTWPAGSQLQAGNLQARRLTLTWTAAQDSVPITSYRLFQGTTVLATVDGATTAFTVTGLLPQTPYQFKVEAVNAAGQQSTTGPSLTVTTPPEATPPTAPTWPSGSQLQASNIQTMSLTLTWTPAQDVQGIAHYLVFQGTTLLATLDGQTRTFTVTGLLPQTQYQFKVEAANAAGRQSTTGPSLTVTTPAEPTTPTPPTWPSGSQLQVSNIQLTSLTLTWPPAEASGGVASYSLFQDGHPLVIVSAATRTLTISGLTPGTAYQFKVEAVDATGQQSTTGPAVAVTTASLPPDLIVSYVTALYRTVLKREPEPAGLRFWMHLVESGTGLFQVVQGFWESREHRGLQVNDFYATYLHRAAEPAGQEAWIQALQGGMTETEMARLFVTSAEYTASHKDPTAFVQGLYTDVLGRTADAAGLAFWVQVAQQPRGRDTAAQGILTSTEAYRRLLDRYYADYLHRGEDAVGREGWLAVLQSRRMSPARVAEEISISEEFVLQAAANRL